MTPATEKAVESMRRASKLAEMATEVEGERANIQASLDDFSARFQYLNTSLNGPLMEDLLGKKQADSKVGVSIRTFRGKLKTLKEKVDLLEKSANGDKKNFDIAKPNTRSSAQFTKAEKALENLKTYKAKIDSEIAKIEELRKTVDLFSGIATELQDPVPGTGTDSKDDDDGVNRGVADATAVPEPASNSVYYVRNPESQWDNINVRASMEENADIVGTIAWEQAGDEVVGESASGDWLKLDVEKMAQRISPPLPEGTNGYVRIRGKTVFLEKEGDTWKPVQSKIRVAPGTNSAVDAESEVDSPDFLKGTEQGEW